MSGRDSVPNLADFTEYERMVGEYRVMGIYPRGHVMEFVRPTLSADVLRAAAVEEMGEGEKVQVAGWPVARQHPRGQDGTVFVTIEDESGDVQAYPLAEGVRQVPQGAGEPGDSCQGQGVPVGRRHQRSRVGSGAHRRDGLDARRPRLALDRKGIGEVQPRSIRDGDAAKMG